MPCPSHVPPLRPAAIKPVTPSYALPLHVIDEREQALHAASCPCHVDVLGAGIFEREAHELAAARNGGPVEKLVGHGFSLADLAPAGY